MDDLESGYDDIQRSTSTGDLRQVIVSVQRFHILCWKKPRNAVLASMGVAC